MTASMASDAAPAGTTEAEPGACALCGMSPGADEPNLLRQLGAAPVTVTVCADSAACVTRYSAAAG